MNTNRKINIITTVIFLLLLMVTAYIYIMSRDTDARNRESWKPAPQYQNPKGK